MSTNKLIGVLRSVLTLDTSNFGKNTNKAANDLGDLSKGIRRTSFDLEHLGRAFGTRFLSAGAALGAATSLIHTMGVDLERIANASIDDRSLLQRGGFSKALDGLSQFNAELLRTGYHTNFVSAALDRLGDEWDRFSGAEASRSAYLQAQSLKAFYAPLIEQKNKEREAALAAAKADSDAFAKRQENLDTYLGSLRREYDVLTHTNRELAQMEARKQVQNFNGGEAYTSVMLDQVTALLDQIEAKKKDIDLTNKLNSILEGNKTAVERVNDQIAVLNDAFEAGKLSIDAYREAYQRLTKSNGVLAQISGLEGRALPGQTQHFAPPSPAAQTAILREISDGIRGLSAQLATSAMLARLN